MEKINLCKGGCGNKAMYKGWCEVKWKKGNRVCVTCPELEKKRAKSISKYRSLEAKLGLNPMQNPEICKKNHSAERNKKSSNTLKKLGKLGILPQQTESKKLREKRFRNIRKALRKLADEGKLNHQIEPKWKKELRHRRISKTLKEKIKKGLIKIVPAKKVLYKSNYGTIIWLRSGWEFEVAKFLDSNKIKWLYEPFPIQYFNSEKGEICNTIPDFFLPKYNLIIEVKSSNKSISNFMGDKIKGIKKAGFNVALWMDKEINLIRKEDSGFLLREIQQFGVKENAQNKN